ncbi:MAG TPA: DEAD/DEAH box helicase family protein [Methanoregulaceae archaeon]|nr:DEAD/DEAH box helicase family protein [Methanoregulaceae archaeon]
MSQVVITNPVINSPFDEPTRHFKFTDEGITNEIIEARRVSSYFIPIAKPRKKGKSQLEFETEWTQDRVEENKLVNQIRQRIALWRQVNRQGVTPVTAKLLEYWTNPEREKKLFFCQIEALETAIYLTEVAAGSGEVWIENTLRMYNDASNDGLPRIAFKMATGSGKTVVMAMIIAWHALNKLSNPQDSRFSDAFLIATPGITIRDRLRVLLPNDPQNYYRQRDIVSLEDLERLGQAKILITNFQSFIPREKTSAGKLTKSILARGKTDAFTETPDQMIRRVCRELGTKRNIIIINDEAHHCYRRKPETEAEAEQIKLKRDEKREAQKRDDEARIWISGILAAQKKIGVKAVYDLSATPFFLRGSGYPEGTLFPWVVSDFSLIDAIESGIVKVPRVPVADDAMTSEYPTYRDLWLHVRDGLPKKSRKDVEVTGEPQLPAKLQGAIHSLYGNYEKYYRLWEQNTEAQAAGATPPVFIVVCNNTNVSKLVFDYIAGWEKQIGDRTVVQTGQLPIFRNDDGAGEWLQRPNTILIDSQQLESGEAMSDDFKKIASREIEEFKAEYRIRFPGRDADQLTDEDLLREVMNTVGKPGKLGEQVKCVVSVSMLTEGWDANTVTHILGIRAFSTQLLCEQVVGRALRRMSYATNSQGMFEPEYAEVYGVPFSFIPTQGGGIDLPPPVIPTRVRALEDRIACEITFPRLTGYRYDIAGERIAAQFTEDSKLALSTEDIPTRTEMEPIVGIGEIHTLDDLKKHRENEVAFLLAKETLEHYFSSEGDFKPWLFPQLLAIAKRWMAECVTMKDNTFPQLLLLKEFAQAAVDRIYRSIVQASPGRTTLKPILRPYDTVGSTRFVDFDTTRPVWATDPGKCHISHVVADTDSWEQKMAQVLEEMPEVVRYVKNHGLNFLIPYTFEGQESNYIPDFIACVDDGHGPESLLNLIIEVTGEKKKDKAAKVATAHTLWVPAVNNHGGFGRWSFLEISDPWDAEGTIRGHLRALGSGEGS